EEQGQDQYQRDQKKDLPCHGEEQSFHRFSDRREEIGGDELNSVYNDHKEEGPHEMDGEFEVERAALHKQRYDLIREKLKKDKSDRGDDKTARDGKLIGLPHPGVLFRTVVEADDRLGALGESDEERER